MQKMLNFVFLLLICLMNLQPSSCQEDLRNVIISAMENAVMFLAENRGNVRDILLEVTILEGYLEMIVETWERRAGLTTERQRIMALREKVSTFREEAATDVETKDPAFHKDFAPALKPGFWKIPRKWKNIKSSMPYSLTSGNCLDLITSDFCISGLLERQDDSDVCQIPDSCSNLMTNTHCEGYSLSHQLFFFLFARMKSCSNLLFQNGGYYENMLCDLMMQTNRNLEKNNLIHKSADLFTENIMLCGLAGFSDFFQTSWLNYILSWQKKDKGCFLMHSACSSHNTAVAVGALGGFLLSG